MHDVFSARVQYNDFKGSVAADQADEIALLKYLQDKGLAKEDEIVIGVRAGFNGNHGGEVQKPRIVVYLAAKGWDQVSPKKVRAIDIDMTTAKLFSFYKRFDLVMTYRGADMDGVEVDGPHYG